MIAEIAKLRQSRSWDAISAAVLQLMFARANGARGGSSAGRARVNAALP